MTIETKTGAPVTLTVPVPWLTEERPDKYCRRRICLGCGESFEYPVKATPAVSYVAWVKAHLSCGEFYTAEAPSSAPDAGRLLAEVLLDDAAEPVSLDRTALRRIEAPRVKDCLACGGEARHMMRLCDPCFEAWERWAVADWVLQKSDQFSRDVYASQDRFIAYVRQQKALKQEALGQEALVDIPLLASGLITKYRTPDGEIGPRVAAFMARTGCTEDAVYQMIESGAITLRGPEIVPSPLLGSVPSSCLPHACGDEACGLTEENH